MPFVDTSERPTGAPEAPGASAAPNSCKGAPAIPTGQVPYGFGEQPLSVFLERGIPRGADVTVYIAEERSRPLDPYAAKLQVTIPPVATGADAHSRDVKVQVYADGVPLEGTFTLRLYPTPNPVVTSIVPSLLLEQGQSVLPGMVTVRGTGFYGPDGKMELAIGGTPAKGSLKLPGDEGFAATVPPETPAGMFVPVVTLFGRPAVIAPGVHVTVRRAFRGWELLVPAVIILLAAAALLAWFVRVGNDPRTPSLLRDSRGTTLSLARFQLLWWLVICFLSDLSLTVLQGLVQPDAGLALHMELHYPVLLALTIFLLTHMVDSWRGAPATAGIEPSWRDTIRHGGVEAGECVVLLSGTIVLGVATWWNAVWLFLTGYPGTWMPAAFLQLLAAGGGAFLVGRAIRGSGPAVHTVWRARNLLSFIGTGLRKGAMVIIKENDQANEDHTLPGNVLVVEERAHSRYGRGLPVGEYSVDLERCPPRIAALLEGGERVLQFRNPDGQYADYKIAATAVALSPALGLAPADPGGPGVAAPGEAVGVQSGTAPGGSK